MKQRKERNNGGFTLIELLIAIMILGIIVAPFMHSFVTAARTNSKAQKVQNATSLATNIMEELKANTVEDFAFQFNYPLRGDNTNRFDVVNQFSKAYELVYDNGSLINVLQYAEKNGVNNRDYVTSSVIYPEYEANVKDAFEFKGQDSGRYYFVLEDAKVGESYYDAMVKLDTNNYKTVNHKGYNDQQTPQIDSLDLLQDAFYVQSAKQDADYAQKLADRFTSVKAEDLTDGNYTNGEMSRKIIIDIENKSNIQQVFVTYEYTYNGEKESLRSLIYDNAESQANEVRSVYLFYLPFYSSREGHLLDTIEINNLDNQEVDVYLVKQRVNSVDTSYLLTQETTYKTSVTVKEDAGSYSASSHRAYMTLRTNLGANLYQSSLALANQYDLLYGSETRVPAINSNNRKILGVSGLDGAEVKDRIYDVTVTIYEKGEASKGFTGRSIVEITGSKDN